MDSSLSGFKYMIRASKRAEIKNKLWDEIFGNNVNDYPAVEAQSNEDEIYY